MKSMKLDIDARGIAVLTMDAPGASVNTVTEAFASDLEQALYVLGSHGEVRALVLASAKADNFHAGADLKDAASKLASAESATELVRELQALFNKIRGLKIPVVAAIHGSCLGGGLELALACHARVATDHRKTKLGCPEVKLGLLPAAGGCQLLPRLVGLQKGLDLVLSGKELDARQAKKIGLVDEVVAPALLKKAALELATELAEHPTEGDSTWSRIGASFGRWFSAEAKDALLEDNPLGRKLVFDQAHKRLLQKTRGHYPAPERALEAVRIGMAEGIEAGLAAEARFFGELVTGPVAKELIRIFLVTTAMKKETGVVDFNVVPRPVDRLGVLGAGLMGSGIAEVSAIRAGCDVRMKDRDAEAVGRGLAAIRSGLDQRVNRRRMKPRERQEIMARISPTTDYSGFSGCKVMIEAVFEDITLKHQVVREVEAATSPETIFASNTSTIPITRIAEVSKHPETVIGMHYFSPVPKMPLLEVIITNKTAPWVTATCVELGHRQGKTVIVVKDGVGFYTSRILGPYMNEAFRVLAEGVPIEAIDGALLDFGFPVGPVKLLDEVGIDVAYKASKVVRETHGEQSFPPGLENLVKDGRLGRKSKKGFYLYDGKKKGVDTSVYDVIGVRPDKKLPAQDIAERCVLSMINEAYKCLNEGILLSERDGDIGAIFGLGFPPFRGGPFRYVDSVGKDVIRAKMTALAAQHGARFTPAM